MPASETREEQRNGRLLGLLFWGGVGLAPVAALLLLIGGGEGTLRAAIGVLTLSVILIGLSITLRRDSDAVRLEMEDMLFDEIDAVRADVRDDISTAAHATHRSFGEKLHYVNEQLEMARGELDATRAHLDALRHEVARLELVRAETGRPEPIRHGVPQAAQGARPGSGAVQPPVPAGPNRPGMPPGMVRHTETVQVTTRHTIVDPHADDGPRVGAGTVYGSPGFDRGRPETPDFIARPEAAPRPRTEPRGVGAGPALRGPQSHSADPIEESWTEQRLREQLERRRDAAEPVQRDAPDRWPSRDSWAERPEADRWAERGEPDRWTSRDDDDDDRRPALRTGDRWASVRSDDRGRELRVGERRAALHSDESGTELRIEDRWAAVRREDARGAGSWRDEDDRLDEPRSGFPWRDSDREASRTRDADWRESDRGDRGERRAITGSDAGDRWSDFDDYDDRDRGRRRRRD